MELGETAEEGCLREAREEAGIDIELNGLLGMYSIPRIGQIHLVWLASLKSLQWTAGPESLDVTMMPIADVLQDELAFPVNDWALHDYLSLQGEPLQQPFTTRLEHLHDRLSTVEFHPDFPPPSDVG